MTVICRVLVEEELRDAYEFGRVAFGGPRLEPEKPLPPRPGRIAWGAYDDGRLVAMAGDRVQGQWFGGNRVSASGISSVAVAPGERGKGYAQQLVTAVLASARERGAVVSTLFPTAPALYRRLGWEETGVLTWWDLPTTGLASVPTPPGYTTRAAVAVDREAMLGVYRAVAAVNNGYLDRDDARFPEWPFHQDYGFDGITLALAPDDTIVGVTSWERGLGYGPEARLTVSDLVGLDINATNTLLASIGSWGAVLPTASIMLPRPDPLWWGIPQAWASARSVWPWMTRVVDVSGAFAARGWPANIDVSVELEISDEQCPWNAGRFVLQVADGQGTVSRGGAGHVAVGARGLGVLFAGGVPVAQLIRGGLIDAGVESAAALDAMFAGPPPTTLNYF